MGELATGYKLVPLRRIAADGGDVFHGMKKTDPGFNGFGEVYFSSIDAGSVKAWKRHRDMTLNLVVVHGWVRFVVVDGEGDFREIELSPDRVYSRLVISPGTWFGFQGLGSTTSVVANIADIEHNPEECDSRKIDELMFDWQIQY